MCRDCFHLKTAECMKKQGEVAGRLVTVVKAPGWSKDMNSKDIHKLTKQEIVNSMSLCHPGPHALLLVMNNTYSVKEARRMHIQRHVELLGETVWNHTMVLFTGGDYLGDIPIEQHIDREGKDLKWIVDKCGNRYHVLNNHNRGDNIQVTELLEKIEEMVAGNRGCHFEMDKMKSQDLNEKKEQSAKPVDRDVKMYREIATLKFVMGELNVE